MKRPFALIGITYLSVQTALFLFRVGFSSGDINRCVFYRNDCFALYT